jgi:hypothetical protein
MQSLIDAIKRSMEGAVEFGECRFFVRRPTDAELIDNQIRSGYSFAIADLPKYVFGWEGVRERDIQPGGSDKPVPFSPALAEAWLSNRADILGLLSTEVTRLIEAAKAARDDAPKNS